MEKHSVSAIGLPAPISPLNRYLPTIYLDRSFRRENHENLKHSIAGAGAGIVSSIVTCPLDVVKTRLQNQGTGHPGIALYRGTYGKYQEGMISHGFPITDNVIERYPFSDMDGRRHPGTLSWPRTNDLWIPAHLGDLFHGVWLLQRTSWITNWQRGRSLVSTYTLCDDGRRNLHYHDQPSLGHQDEIHGKSSSGGCFLWKKNPRSMTNDINSLLLLHHL